MARWMTVGWAAAAAVGIGLAAGGALAQDEKTPMTAGAKAAQQRHANFEQLGKLFGALNGELRKPEPDKVAVAATTKAMRELANALPTWFPRGSGVEARPLSHAKANIWTDAAGFTAAASNLQAQIGKLDQAAVSGDLAAVRSEVRATGGACKACHDVYRSELKPAAATD
jgi:cytochrome c556